MVSREQVKSHRASMETSQLRGEVSNLISGTAGLHNGSRLRNCPQPILQLHFRPCDLGDSAKKTNQCCQAKQTSVSKLTESENSHMVRPDVLVEYSGEDSQYSEYAAHSRLTMPTSTDLSPVRILTSPWSILSFELMRGTMHHHELHRPERPLIHKDKHGE